MEIKKYLQLLIIPFMISSNVPATKSCNGVNKDCIKLHLSMTYNEPYCGGALPTPEILEYHKKARMLAEATLLIKKDGEEREERVKTDEKGNVKVCLPVGAYKLYLTEDFKKLYPEFDVNCKAWVEKTVVAFEVNEEVEKSQLFNFNVVCNPCSFPKP